jgi:RNA polymerase sigma factor (sigma-70 family)
MSSPATDIDSLMVHATWLRRFAGALLRDGDDADDLVQGTLVSAWQHPPADGSRPRSWLARIAQNRAHDQRRSDQRRSAREQEAVEIAVAQPSTPEQLLGDLEIHRTVAEVVTALDEPYRQAVLLRYYEGLSAADIGTRLGVPAGTIRWRLKEGLDRVRRALDGRCGDRRRWMLALAPLVPRLPGATPVAGLTLLAVLTLALIVGAGLWLRLDRPDPAAHPADVTSSAGAASPRAAGPGRSGGPPRFATRVTIPALTETGTDPAVAEADTIVRHMLAAIASGSYEAFLAYADDTFKARLFKETMQKLSADLAGPLERGFQLQPLGSLDRQGFRTFLWRLDLRGEDDQRLVNVSLKDGLVGGFWIQ